MSELGQSRHFGRRSALPVCPYHDRPHGPVRAQVRKSDSGLRRSLERGKTTMPTCPQMETLRFAQKRKTRHVSCNCVSFETRQSRFFLSVNSGHDRFDRIKPEHTSNSPRANSAHCWLQPFTASAVAGRKAFTTRTRRIGNASTSSCLRGGRSC